MIDDEDGIRIRHLTEAVNSNLARISDSLTDQERALNSIENRLELKERFYDAETGALLHERTTRTVLLGRPQDRAHGGADVHDERVQNDLVPVAPLPPMQIHRGGLRRARARLRHAALQVITGARQPATWFWWTWAAFVAGMLGVSPWG